MSDVPKTLIADAPEPGVAGLESDPGKLERELKELVADVEAAGREWGVRSDSKEGRFVSALLGTMGWLGKLSAAARTSFEAFARENREAAEMELARAREITKAASIGLTQARNAQIFLQVEQENLVARMIHETLPLFIEKLQGALLLRERRWNDALQRRRYAAVGLVTLGLFLSGYILRAWEDGGPADALAQCLTHPLAAQGHLYCDVTSFARAAQ